MICKRIILSNDKVNIFNLAKNLQSFGKARATFFWFALKCRR